MQKLYFHKSESCLAFGFSLELDLSHFFTATDCGALRSRSSWLVDILVLLYRASSSSNLCHCLYHRQI